MTLKLWRDIKEDTHTHTHGLKKKTLFFLLFFLNFIYHQLVESKRISKRFAVKKKQKSKERKFENSFHCQQTLLLLARTTRLAFVNCFTLKLFKLYEIQICK